MIHPELLEQWSRLAEHPELLAAVEHGESVPDEVAHFSVLRALSDPADPASAVRQLIALGASESARAVLDDAPRASDDAEAVAGTLAAVDYQALVAELDAAGAYSRTALHLDRARLEARAAQATLEAALPWPGEDDSDAYAERFEDCAVAIEQRIGELETAMEAQLAQLAEDAAWPPEQLATVRPLVRAGRIRDARRLIAGPRELGECWPAVAHGPWCVPAQFTPLGVWPWRAPIGEVLGWLGRGPQTTLPPPGFTDAFGQPADDRSAQMLAAFTRASQAPERSAAIDALLEAVACGLHARIGDIGEQALLLDDDALTAVPALTALTVVSSESDQRRVVLRPTNSDTQMTLTDGDLLAAAAAGEMRRARLLRVLGTQLDLEAAQLGTAALPAGDHELLLGWSLWFLGVEPDDQAVSLAWVLGAARWEVAAHLMNAALARHSRGTPLTASAVAAAWRATSFADALRAWLDARVEQQEERKLLEDLVALDDDEVPLELLGETGPIVANALADRGLIAVASDMLRSTSPLRAVLRKALGV